MALLKTATMKAVRFHSYGGSEVLVAEEIRRPEPSTGEILIEVRAVAVNPIDWKVREGYAKEWINHRLPMIPGWDVSGVVSALGPGTDLFKVGDEVYGRLDIARDGAYAEYAVARASHMARKPVTIDHVHAASIPIAATTAWQALFHSAGLISGQTVLIHAASGGVGHFAVQFARWQGVNTIGTTSAGNVDFVRSLGAGQVIDYRSTRFEEVVKDADAVLDTLGGDTQRRSWKVLKKSGILVSTISISSPDTAAEYGVRGVEVISRADSAQLTRIASLVDEGVLKPFVSVVLPLSDAVKALELSRKGHIRGKMVLKVSD